MKVSGGKSECDTLQQVRPTIYVFFSSGRYPDLLFLLASEGRLLRVRKDRCTTHVTSREMRLPLRSLGVMSQPPILSADTSRCQRFASAE